MVRKFLMLVGLIYLLWPQMAQGQTTPHFGSGMAWLNDPAATVDFDIFVGRISNRYVVGVFGHDGTIRDSLYLWDLSVIDPLGGLVMPAPRILYDLSQHVGQHLDMEIAPDESVVALMLPGELVLLTLPEVTVLKTVAVEEGYLFPEMRLSPDGELIGAYYDETGTLLVWEPATDRIERFTGKSGYAGLYALKDGWLLDYNTDQFVVCSTYLVNCRIYTGTVSAVSDQFLITLGDSPVLWNRRSDGSYRPDATRLVELGDNVQSIEFSPNNQYFVSDMTLWNFKRLKPLYQLPIRRDPIWLDSQTFALGYAEVYLFRANNSTPLAVLPFEAIEGLDLNQVGWHPELNGTRAVSPDGRWLLHVFGETALVIPVIE